MKPKCRFCSTELVFPFLDLGMSPLCESFVPAEQLEDMEIFYPLHVYVCHNCFLVQLMELVDPEYIFTEYAYFSSYSESWLDHARRYVNMIIEKLDLGKDSQVVEIASNDGYLLQYFVEKGIPAVGIEPAANVAAAAQKKKINTIVRFFDKKTAQELAAVRLQADLLIGNNVLAHVPDINDFVEGLKILLAPGGVITMEFPHLVTLIQGNQFDTIYHEHFSYLSGTTVQKIFSRNGLNLFDAEKLSTHGGSLRIYACHGQDDSRKPSAELKALLSEEKAFGVTTIETYFSFSEKVKAVKRRLLALLIDIKKNKKSIAGYGAPGKGNTLLNYCGIRTDFLDYTVDRNPYKHGKFLPGTRIPIFSPEKIRETRPDYVMILPWNLKTEIIEQIAYIRSWGGKFIVPIPDPKILE